MMQQDFPNGTLLLPQYEPLGPEAGILRDWAAYPEHTVAVIAAIVVVLACTPNFKILLPFVTSCMSRVRACISMERNLSLARRRNFTTFLMCLPLALTISRYRLYEPTFLEDLYGWRYLLGIFAMMGAYFGIKYLFGRGRNAERDVMTAARNVQYTFLLACSTAVTVTVAVLAAFGAPDAAATGFIYTELAVFYLLSVIRCSQILAISHSPFGTILYLCRLELVPTALLVLSATLL